MSRCNAVLGPYYHVEAPNPKGDGEMDDFMTDLMVRLPGEDAAFCYHCGGMLAPARMTTGLKEPGFGSCMECGQKGYRLYAHVCPICGDGGWVHLQVPVRCETAGRIITEARGTGWCDCCASPVVYCWTRNGGDPEIVLVGMDAEGETTKVRVEARKAIHVES